jgi:hypothetical protein
MPEPAGMARPLQLDRFVACPSGVSWLLTCPAPLFESATADRLFPDQRPKQVTIRGLTAASGQKLRVSPDAAFAARVTVTEQE